jgi:hypothetical protein
MSIRYLNIKLVIISDLRHLYLDIILKYIFSMTLTILKPDD